MEPAHPKVAYRCPVCGNLSPLEIVKGKVRPWAKAHECKDGSWRKVAALPEYKRRVEPE